MTPTEIYFGELDVAHQVDILGIDEHPDRCRLSARERRLVSLLATGCAAVYVAVGFGVGEWLGWWG